jgi:opacity protein-like surface antigen
MKKLLLAAVAAVGLAGSAQAAVITLENVVEQGPNGFRFRYQGTLGPDEGVRSGDRLVIRDFAGYIDGSIFGGGPNLTASTELVSADPLTPGFNDDPNLVNLVFTYTGPDFRASGGPFQPFNFNNLGARSTFSGLTQDAFFTLTTKNNPDGAPGGSGTAVFTLGQVTVPTAVPEPASWAMMIGGFGLIGAATRRRSRVRTAHA